MAIPLRALIILVNHSNLALPERLDALLRPFVVTPDFHRVHHSSEKRFTDSNFGTVLPLFDYLCGTARSVPYDAQPGMRCGLHAWREDADSRIDRLLLLPFRWRRPQAVDGSATQSGAARTPVNHTTGLAAENNRHAHRRTSAAAVHPSGHIFVEVPLDLLFQPRLKQRRQHPEFYRYLDLIIPE
ncbi:MAG: sterol desaturase family protein [Halioglobus sp.]|nr:sterol desaturase family protein [Halioglobus sp.]